ncbi:hypothetical protein PtB15_12B1 [Puccinia triticina]|nr:hypothetical protein PtB15_12B1 [Puccinia triticina]
MAELGSTDIPEVVSPPTAAKIRPCDYPNLRFMAENVERFLDRFDNTTGQENLSDGDKLLHAFKNAMGKNQWVAAMTSLTPQTAQRLHLLYQV